MFCLFVTDFLRFVKKKTKNKTKSTIINLYRLRNSILEMFIRLRYLCVHRACVMCEKNCYLVQAHENINAVDVSSIDFWFSLALSGARQYSRIKESYENKPETLLLNTIRHWFDSWGFDRIYSIFFPICSKQSELLISLRATSIFTFLVYADRRIQ